MPLPEILFLAVNVMLVTGAQLLIRSGARRIDTGRGLLGLIQPRLFAGWLLVLGAPFFYFRALRALPLSAAYGATALTYLLVPAGAALFLKERLNRGHLSGLALVAAGIVLWYL